MFDIKENLKKLPDSPGVYIHKDNVGQVIYVGKAISLKNRVRQYFQSPKNQTDKVRAMVSNIHEFEYITCKTEMEALILECNLIKKYQPKYNVLLRDDKTYPYIKLSLNEDYPRLTKTRIIKKDGAKYFGPFSDVKAVNDTVALLNKVYALKRCPATDFSSDYRPCLNYHINECEGICTGKVSKEAYAKKIEKVISFLSGKQKEIIDYLKEEMEKASEELRFEDASKFRDFIESAKALKETQRVSFVSGQDLDIVIPVGKDRNTSVLIFPVRKGKLSGRETYSVQARVDDDYDTIVSEFIKQYYSKWSEVPPEILVPKPLKEGKLIEEYLKSLEEGRSVHIYVPMRGAKKELLNLVIRDSQEIAKTIDEKIKAQEEKENEILERLNLITGEEKDYFRVESYDISNTNGADTVGAMVVFGNLKPIKKAYRRFKIKSVTGPDDYGALREMLQRRLNRAKDGDPGFSELPDVIFMDGGLGQVTSAVEVIKRMGFSIPVFGMAKDDSHRTRALVNEFGQEFELSKDPILFKYLGNIQEEVHRFAIDYHRSLHRKNSIGSILDNIDGIGPKKRNALLKHFDTIEDIKKADKDSLLDVPGINEKNAEAIMDYFRK